jgi:hypothetical protein
LHEEIWIENTPNPLKVSLQYFEHKDMRVRTKLHPARAWVRLAGHVARMGYMRNADKILVGKPDRKRPVEDLGVDGKIIIEWTGKM